MKILRNGQEVVLSAEEQAAFEAALPSPEEVATAAALADLASSDAPFVRVLDDLIDALIGKGAIAETDLPQAARDKRAARAAARGQLLE